MKATLAWEGIGFSPAADSAYEPGFSPCGSHSREFSCPSLKLKIDVSGTVGDDAWREIHQFDQIQSADFGPQFGSGGRCNHPPDAPHAKGEWIGAEIRLQTPLLAQYAMSHYLEQERVLDADVENKLSSAIVQFPGIPCRFRLRPRLHNSSRRDSPGWLRRHEPTPKRGMSRTQKILFFATGWLIVLMPFLFWWNTWFGRHLSDQQLTEYLHDDKKPRHIQHALVQMGDRMSHGDAAVKQWYPDLIRIAGRASGRGSQHRRLGHGAGHLRRRLSRSAAEDACGFFPDGARQCSACRWCASAMRPAVRRS